MKNELFIQNFVRGLNKDHAKNQNLFSEYNILYSYGYHYPLLVRLDPTTPDGRAIFLLNDSGYSPTTRRHIFNARRFADGVFTGSSHDGSTTNAKRILELVNYEIKGKTDILNTLSPRAFRQRANYQVRIELLEKTKTLINNLK